MTIKSYEPEYKILVIDDSLSIRKLMSNILVNGGYEVDTFSLGLDAISAMKKNKYHLAIVDYHLPDINGDRVVKIIRCLENYSTTPILIIKSDNTTENIELFKKIGANGWIPKPLNSTRVLTAVHAMIKKSNKKK